ncbi:hypothetical protein [Mucilaginibacter sp.]
MKTPGKTNTSKLTSRFDKELMNILINDLKAAKAKSHSRLKV